MPDYDLCRLSTRSFEQLIQSLAVRVIAPGAIVFGDGPDGAREATYEGKMQYPSGHHPWSGYLVIQAKFRQRTEGTTKDGRWALAQLEAELKKFSNRKRKLRRPEYYLFCTNVVLSAVARRGAKEKALQMLKAAKRRTGLKGFDIWDYDKLRALLDDCEDIRHAYAAFITPGDVLSHVMATVLRRPDLNEVMTVFLQKELLEDQYVNLRQAGHLTDREPPMVKVFVDLPASEKQEPEIPKEAVEAGKLPPAFASRLIDIGNLRLPEVGEAQGPRQLTVFEDLRRAVPIPG